MRAAPAANGSRDEDEPATHLAASHAVQGRVDVVEGQRLHLPAQLTSRGELKDGGQIVG